MANSASTENPKLSLGDLRDLLIVIGIFLFFTGWVYNYYYYDYFGLSLSQVQTDYSTYIVYSFLVIISNYYLPLVSIVILFLVYMKWLRYYFKLTVVCALTLFPGLYVLAKSVANQNAVALRSTPNQMRHIVFVFKESAELLNYKTTLDSITQKDPLVTNDISILRSTVFPGPLYLLGQNDKYYFVLNQPPKAPEIRALPIGNVYFVNKDEVLYTKISITLNQ